jgi:hypothetical protein
MYRRRRILARVGGLMLAVAVGVGLFAMGRSSATATKAAAASETPPSSSGSSDKCAVVEHSPEGAATTAAVGLYQLALANMGSPASSPQRTKTVEDILARYVVPDQRSVMREYLQASQSTLTDILETPLAYQVVSYGQPGNASASPDSATEAVIRLLVVDYGRAADGTSKSSSGVIDATLQWDATQGFWRLAKWPGNDDPAALAQLLQNKKGFCHAASAG